MPSPPYYRFCGDAGNLDQEVVRLVGTALGHIIISIPTGYSVSHPRPQKSRSAGLLTRLKARASVKPKLCGFMITDLELIIGMLVSTLTLSVRLRRV